MGRRTRVKRDTLHEVGRLVWAHADGFVRVRLAAVLALVVLASLLTALSPVALKLVVDALAGQSNEGGGSSITLLLGAYVLAQFLARAAGELRG
ncbi:MAG TPA: hypothetical protein VJQ82_23545, partial [Terriglobales bacterium]|nr:hypothetical protein [Terriglobales bacterium]